MPDTPAAPPVAAPVAAAPAPSTPAPAAQPSTSSSAPASQSNPAPATTTTAQEGGSPPAASPETLATNDGKPNRTDYGEDIHKFLIDTYAWEEKQAATEGSEAEAAPETEGESAAEPSTEEANPAEAEKDAETEAETETPPEVEAPTPEGLSKLFEAHPEIAAAINANPAVKGQLFAMARQNAKAAPVLEVFPNVESAKFANETANTFIGIRTAFELSDTPEKMGLAAGQFLEQFAVVDDQGKPVLDQAGQPTYGDDLDLFVGHITKRERSARLASVEERLAANAYVTPGGRVQDEDLRLAYQIVQEAEDGEKSGVSRDKPDTSTLTPEMKAYFDRREAELEAERERLGVKSKDLTKKTIVETRERYNTQYRQEFGAGTARYIANYMKQKETEGVVVPRYLFDMKVRTPQGDEIPAFFVNAFNKLDAKLSGLSEVRSKSATLQMNAINDQSLQARVRYGQSLIDEHLPAIIDAELRAAGASLAADAKQRVTDRADKQKGARVEPSAGQPSTPRNLSGKQSMDKARETVLAKNPSLSGGELIAAQLKERDRMESLR